VALMMLDLQLHEADLLRLIMDHFIEKLKADREYMPECITEPFALAVAQSLRAKMDQ
jgi:hypothetical protein